MDSDHFAGEDVPIPAAHVSTVATREDVPAADLAEALAAIHGDLVDGADAIHEYYRSEDTPESLVVADGLAEVIFVDTATWEQIPTDLPEGIRTAARAVHEAFARDFGVPEETLATYDALVMPAAEVGQLVRAGLSRRQAEVQLLRNDGLTQTEIADRLGLATNTVKVHCHRIDTKVTDAKRLLDVVEA